MTTEPFIRSGTYPDEDLIELVNQTCKKLNLSPKDAHFSFGKWIFPHLTKIAPPEVTTFKHPKKLFLRLDHIHRVELKKIWPDAEPPRFQCIDTGPNSVTMTYDSIREMADLVEGVIESVAMNYQTAIQFEKKHIKKKTITYMNIF
ncbi:heme NO-binding domain-containing protein [uncultured Shewanella sp.]|uniref:heme NO-binding domain-containing protein n=1 Tax=uncultured Shewanella sp. TaxID=173975 RepID=UPI00344FC794